MTEANPKIEVVDGGIEIDEEAPSLGPEGVKLTHTLLEMWDSVLNNVDEEREAPITPALAMQVLQRWPMMRIEEMGTYHANYYNILEAFRDAVADEIEEDKGRLKHVEDDAEHNKDAYARIIFQWTDTIRDAEEDWEFDEPHAVSVLAAIADATNFSLSGMGLVAHLDQIGVTISLDELEEVGKQIDQKKERTK